MRKQKEIIFIFKVYVCINNHNEAANDVINILGSEDMKTMPLGSWMEYCI